MGLIYDWPANHKKRALSKCLACMHGNESQMFILISMRAGESKKAINIAKYECVM